MTEEKNTELIESVANSDSNIRLREAFELFDADKDGEITLDELQKVNKNKTGTPCQGGGSHLPLGFTQYDNF